MDEERSLAMAKTFDSTRYNGKEVIYVDTNGYPGIRAIFEWDKQRRRYVRRSQGLRYYAYRKMNGKQVSHCFSTLNEARAWRDKGYEVSEFGQVSGLTFAQLKSRFFEWKKTQVKSTTLETYEVNTQHLCFFNQMLISRISARTIDEWLNFVKKPSYRAIQHPTRMTYRHELDVLRLILSFYAEYFDDSYQVPIKKRHLTDAVIDHTKYKEEKAKKSRRYIPWEVCENFLGTLRKRAEGNDTEWPFFIAALLQLRTGMRIGEACALSWPDVDLRNGKIWIAKTVHWSRRRGRKSSISPTTKTGKPRLVECPSDVIEVLKSWRARTRRTKGLICSQSGFQPVEYRAVQQRYNRVFKTLGLEFRSTHILRHSFATDYLEATKNQHALREQLGHSDDRQTQHYAKVTEQLKAEGMKSYEKSLQNRSKVILFGSRAG